MSKSNSKWKILAFLGLIVAGNVYATTEVSTQETQESAAMVATLIQNGQASVDPKTGKLVLNKSVLKILEEQGLVDSIPSNSAQMASGGCQRTAGGCY